MRLLRFFDSCWSCALSSCRVCSTDKAHRSGTSKPDENVLSKDGNITGIARRGQMLETHDMVWQSASLKTLPCEPELAGLLMTSFIQGTCGAIATSSSRIDCIFGHCVGS